MKTSHYLLLITAAITANLTADTIVLKTGKKYEGKVISEDDKSYLLEVRVTKSIKDERRIPKDQVQEIIKEAKDATDIEKVKELVPTPDRTTAEDYALRIKVAEDFLTKYPKSTHLKAVNTILEILTNEQQTIAKGGLKLGGQLISASDVEANAYDIHARILLIDMRNLAASGKNQQALRRWETLKNNYVRSTAYKSSMTMVGRILNAHTAELKTNINTLEVREAKRKSALDSLQKGDRDRTIALLAKNKKAYEALIEKEEKEMRTMWLTIDPYHKKALEYNLRNATNATKALGSQNTSTAELAGPTFRGAWSALAKGDLEKATTMIRKLESMQLPKKYTAPLAKQLAKKQWIKATEEKAAKERAEREWMEKVKAEEEAKAAKEAEEKKNPKRGRKKETKKEAVKSTTNEEAK